LTVGAGTSTIWGTVTGSSVLTNMTGAGMPTNKYIGRIAIDPVNANIAYVCFGGFNIAAGAHVWKTTNLLSGTPTWAAAGLGLPDVPVNAFAIDPMIPGRLFAGTDVGVYTSLDGGTTWSPYTTGMPVVAVFDMVIQPTSRTLRVATHGRGIFERALDAVVATQLALVGTEIVNGHPRMTWYSADGAREVMKLYRRAVPGEMEYVTDLQADGTGQLTYEDTDVKPGQSYEYKIGVTNNGVVRYLGQVWVDVPMNAAFALRSLSANPARGALQMSVSLASDSPASLDLMDITGRRVAGRDLGTLSAGEHTVSLDRGNVQPGVYWVRLSQAGKVASVRVSLVK
ncbi:MAG: T9SS type A sorting domain-containing protein, partial [Candidatus Eisenbacteria bacterium]|nr:T9SS type A sorting domain-containing protein [Candidatus Eisenbacteria bacterium]